MKKLLSESSFSKSNFERDEKTGKYSFDIKAQKVAFRRKAIIPLRAIPKSILCMSGQKTFHSKWVRFK
jgi:hypothetical protein